MKYGTPSFITVRSESETEHIVNRSRFIGRCFPVATEAEAAERIAEIRKKHWNATHNCFAYRIGRMAETARFSDDGEPSSTAGKPIMDVLAAKDITNVLCVVTRYFGGVLLGAGGLVRAYSRSAADAVAQAGTVRKTFAICVSISMDYQNYSASEAYVRSRANICGSDFGERVELKAFVPEAELDTFESELTELTNGRIRIERTQIADYVELGYNIEQ